MVGACESIQFTESSRVVKITKEASQTALANLAALNLPSWSYALIDSHIGEGAVTPKQEQ